MLVVNGIAWLQEHNANLININVEIKVVWILLTCVQLQLCVLLTKRCVEMVSVT